MSDRFPLALPEGTVLAGQYIVDKVLGQGGFGITYAATDHKTGAKVAVKEFFPDAMATRTGQTTVVPFTGERGDSYAYGKTCFLQEAETLAQFIGSENIVRIHSYFEENGTAYFVMDFVEGTSFDEYLRQHGGKVSFEEAARILIPVMDALSIVHSRGIVHRDVTPDNIYITKEGGVKLLDFGAARYSLGDKSRSLDIVLKHGFAPKEQYARRGKQGPFTDVYSLGATFYFALTGKRPPDSIERMDEDDLVPPSALGVQIDKAAEDAILLALSVQPAERFQSMAAFKDAMLNVVQGEASRPAPESAPAVAQRFFSAPEAGNVQGEASPGASPAGGAVPPTGRTADGNGMSFPAAEGEADGGRASRKKGLLIGAAVAVPVLLVGILVLALTGRNAEPAGASGSESQESASVAMGEGAQPQGTVQPPVFTPEPTPEVAATPEPTPEPTPIPTVEPTAVPSGGFAVRGNTPENLMNGGICATMDGLDYQIVHEGHALQYHDLDSESYAYVYEDEEGVFSGLSATDGRLYFLYEGAAYVHEVETGALETVSVLEGFSGILKLFVLDDYFVIYCADKNVYRVSRADGESVVCCTVESENKFTLSDDGWIYYVDRNADDLATIWRKRLDTMEEGENSICVNAEKPYMDLCNPIVLDDYLYLCIFDASNIYNCSMLRCSRDLSLENEHLEWMIGSTLNEAVKGYHDSYDYYFNIDNRNRAIYFGINGNQGDGKGTSYFFQIKGKEDGTFDHLFLTQDAYSPNILYFENGNYDVFYRKKNTDENGNATTEVMVVTHDADGNIIHDNE